ncbi:MAG TPA: universal stress protein [Puia sp.]|nr:universal stress protein [Puia sp.]
MNTFLVPMDFSETSKNAARLAAGIANVVPGSQLVLYNVFDTFEAGSDGSLLTSDDDARKTITELALQSVKSELSAITSVPITMAVEEEHDFLEGLERFIRHNNIQLVIMGITGGTKLEQILVGSTSLSLIDRETVPVMIVPTESQFQGVKNIMLVSDFDDVEKTIPLRDLKSVLGLFQGNLHIVNVNEKHYIQLTAEYQRERDRLERMLSEFNPEFYFIRLHNFMDAINMFVADKNIDLIITVPKHHSFFSHVFKGTHTSRLAYKSQIPIIAIHS